MYSIVHDNYNQLFIIDDNYEELEWIKSASIEELKSMVHPANLHPENELFVYRHGEFVSLNDEYDITSYFVKACDIKSLPSGNYKLIMAVSTSLIPIDRYWNVLMDKKGHILKKSEISDKIESHFVFK